MSIKITVEHKGVEYRAAIATIEETHLGFEDHGILTISLMLNGADGWGQSAGNRFLGNSETLSPYLGLQMTAIMKVLGVRKWEDVKGKQILALYDKESPFGRIVGIANFNDQHKVLNFNDHAKEFELTQGG